MYLDRAYTAIINYSISSFTHVFRQGIHSDNKLTNIYFYTCI